MKRWLIAVILMAGLLYGCGGDKRTVGRGRAPRKGQISKVELRDELNRFEYFFIATLKQAASEIDDTAATRRVRRTNMQMRTRIFEALHAMGAADDSVAAFFDTWTLIIRLRIYLEEGLGSKLYNEHQPEVIAFIKTTEAEINRIGQLFLNPNQFEEVQRNLEVFALQHPITGTYANLVVYATQEKEKEAGALMRTLSIPMAPIRAMEGVDNTATAIHRVRDSVERFTDVAEQMPESTRWQMSILVDDFEESEMTQSFLKSLDDFSQSSTRLVEVLDTMPQEMRTELLTVLDESDQGQQQLQTTLQTAVEAAERLEKMFAQLDTTTQSINITAKQANEAAIAWKNASDSIQELVLLFKPQKPRDPNAPPGFGLRDFDTMLLNAGDTADKVTNAVTQLQQTVNAETTEHMQKHARSLIDHIAWRLLQLVLAVFILVWIGRYLMKRMQTVAVKKNQ